MKCMLSFFYGWRELSLVATTNMTFTYACHVVYNIAELRECFLPHLHYEHVNVCIFGFISKNQNLMSCATFWCIARPPHLSHAWHDALREEHLKEHIEDMVWWKRLNSCKSKHISTWHLPSSPLVVSWTSVW